VKGLKWTCHSLPVLGVVSSLIAGAVLVLGGCIRHEPIRVGFSAELTGRQAELGVQERNGAQMAIDKVNATGGIAGRRIELIVRDDLGTSDGAKTADQELIDEGVVAIIGHATTAQTLAGLPVATAARVVMLSPTASSTELRGKSEYFFRAVPAADTRAKNFARHVYEARKIGRLSVVFDSINAAYVQSFWQAFSNEYQSLGGKIVGAETFTSSEQNDFEPILSRLRSVDPDGLLIIAADNDTALISQRARIIGWRVPLFTSAWAQTQVLLHNGGKAVEGMVLDMAHPVNIQSPAFLDFKTRYRERYGHTPSFGAAFGYETALILAAALQQTRGKTDGLRRALSEIRDFQGLVDTFSMGKSGDALRPSSFGEIRNGTFVDIEDSLPTGH
jgi:branched-chain amino acid transport system substrate-binding protein